MQRLGWSLAREPGHRLAARLVEIAGFVQARREGSRSPEDSRETPGGEGLIVSTGRCVLEEMSAAWHGHLSSLAGDRRDHQARRVSYRRDESFPGPPGTWLITFSSPGDIPGHHPCRLDVTVRRRDPRRTSHPLRWTEVTVPDPRGGSGGFEVFAFCASAPMCRDPAIPPPAPPSQRTPEPDARRTARRR